MNEPVWPEPGAPAPAEKPPLGPMRILPALTPEEWAREIYSSSDGELSVEPHVGSGFGDVSVYLMDAGPLLDCECEKDGPYADAGRALTPQDRHALAALALYGQPFGFTRHDVYWLRTRAHLSDGSVDAEMLGIADRIEALLPPEGKE